MGLTLRRAIDSTDCRHHLHSGQPAIAYKDAGT
jgi:hypothetical protein